MHQRAAEADIIIVNHHLFFADLAVRREQMASILPDYNAVIFDALRISRSSLAS